MNLAGMADDIPAQSVEPRPQCDNCPFSARDADDGKLYCHESAPKAQAIYYFRPPEQKKPVITAIGGAPQLATPELVVHGIVTFWPEVQPGWMCWQHPAKQAQRRQHGLATLPSSHSRQPRARK